MSGIRSSGFVLARGTFDKPIAYAQFLKNRVLRIFPLMVFVLVFAIYGSASYTLSSVLAPFLFLANTPLRFDDTTLLSSTIWTVAVEFQFYFVAPFLFLFVSRQGWKYLLLLMAFILVIKLMVLWPNRENVAGIAGILNSTIVGRLSQFLFGIGLAYAVYRAPNLLNRNIGYGVLIISVMAVLVFASKLNQGGGALVWYRWRIVQQDIEGLIWAGVIWGYMAARPFDFLYLRIVAYAMMGAGVVSYSAYILHYPLIYLFWQLYALQDWFKVTTFTGVLLLNAGPLMLVMLALSALSYYCIERPFLNMRRRYIPVAATVESDRRAAA